MPNWCENMVTLTHQDPAMIARAKRAIEQDKLCEEFDPYSGDWDYNWCLENWGTKWDINNGQVFDEYSNSLDCMFQTAWSPPINFFETLESLGFEVEAQYFEPGAAYVGEFANGVDEVFEINPDDFSNIPDYLMEMFFIPEHYESLEDE